jgi:transcriptional regulator GlxA family with amidase domain
MGTFLRQSELMRVEGARRLLQSSAHDLRHIATAAGFGSVDGMRRAFIRVFGRSPRELRAPMERRSSTAL